ncbi:MAG: metal ABC transporter permease, partial [Candidatus Competibacteraceae bacterium]|nr:metal ABC transporter permease [Candidatus Competibacteraceae bacterium]
YWIWGGGVVVLILLALLWRPLLALTVHEELAQVEGVPVFAVRLLFMLLMAVVIALAMKIVGILLITSLLIIPAATARRFARNPESMAILASVIGMLAVGTGVWGSLTWDTPTGPSVVVAAALFFILSMVVPQSRR